MCRIWCRKVGQQPRLKFSLDPDCITVLLSVDPCWTQQYLWNSFDKATALYPQQLRRSITRKWRRRSANFRDSRSMTEANTIERQVGTKGKHMNNDLSTSSSFDNRCTDHLPLSIVTKFGGVDHSVSRTIPVDSAAPKTTSSIVTINVAIEGDSTQLPSIQSRQDLFTALELLASDVQVEDCLLSAEILWAPEERDDYLSRDKIYEMHPNLITL